MIIPDVKLKHFDGEVYQRNKLLVALKYVPDGVVIDCGAHVGTWTKQFAYLAKKVIAIEPNPINFAYLESNLKGINNIELINAVVWDKSEETVKITTDSLSICQHVSDRGLDVKTICLDDINEQPLFIKLDVEGCEYKALIGAERLIKTYRPILYIELKDRCQRKYGSSKERVMALLTEWEYVVVDKIMHDYIYVSKI